jgi:hypothetical protein
MNETPDSWIESEANGAPCDDAGFCNRCHEHLDSGRCECTEEQREAAPTLQEQAEEYQHDRGEQAYLDACEERERNQ